jgi:hypothetical protein
MRDEYDLRSGRPNPYAARFGASGRAELLRWWSRVSAGVRVLPDDVAREFPDDDSTVRVLRLVIQLRAVKPREGARKRRATPPPPRAPRS